MSKFFMTNTAGHPECETELRVKGLTLTAPAVRMVVIEVVRAGRKKINGNPLAGLCTKVYPVLALAGTVRADQGIGFDLVIYDPRLGITTLSNAEEMHSDDGGVTGAFYPVVCSWPESEDSTALIEHIQQATSNFAADFITGE